MPEFKIIIECPELASAINNIAKALDNKKSQTVSEPASDIKSKATNVPISSTISAPAQNSIKYNENQAAIVPLAEAPKYTVEQIMTAGAALVDNGKTQELIALLHSFGVQAVTELKSEQLGAFATAMRGIGAKI